MSGSSIFWVLVFAIGLSGFRLVFVPSRDRRGSPVLLDREADFAHIAMNGVMALDARMLFMPWLSPALWTLSGILLIRLLVLAGRPGEHLSHKPQRMIATAYHLVMALLMVVAMRGASHLVATSIGVLFAADGLITLAGVLFFSDRLDLGWPRDAQMLEGNPVSRRKSFISLGVASIPHLIMDFAMARMLFL